jgi:glycosyltransferase involved in cell wall biosynthesis
MTNDKPVAAIIAAYNEEKTIGAIVKTCVESKIFREVIVISDGSTDRTAEIARNSGATMVHQFPWKHGKGAAIMHGVSHTDAPILFFCDADLNGLSTKHIENILKPVLSGEMSMCVGLRDRGSFIMKLSAHLPLIGGERALQRRVFEDIPDKYLQGFMMETSMNYSCRSKKMNYGTVELPGLFIRRKMQKVGFVKGLQEYFGMTFQMMKAMVIIRLAHFRGEI